jgi:hypothetical protein
VSILIVRYVGLDVHKRVVEVCIVDGKGNVVHRERFALNRRTLKTFATRVLRPTDHVALEATTNCWAVADALRPHVARVLVSNPMATKAIAQAKVKTDKVDAHVLAQLLRCDFLPEVWQPDEATRRMRELTGRRSALVGQRTAMRNRIHSVLAMIGWLMLTHNEPYRYAIPRSTEAKLAKLRVKATGLRRKGGSPKGTKCVAKLPGGSRTIRSLAAACEIEGLPKPQPLSPGEQRMVKTAGCDGFVAEIAAARRTPRPPNRRKSREETHA